MKTFTDEQIAEVIHEANRVYSRMTGDADQVAWADTPSHTRESTISGVAEHRKNPSITPEQSHTNWLTIKLNDGWKFGPVKDADKKEHPCILPFKDLPPEQKFKDIQFRDICRIYFHSPY